MAAKALLKSIGLLLRPIVRLALRNGMTFREFSELSRGLYVDVAAADYGVSGRNTNISRISLITGINRKDIKRFRDAYDAGEDVFAHQSPDRVSRILTGWYTDPRFLDENSLPRELSLEGGQGFEALVKAHGGDIAAITLLREFKRSGVVEELESGKIKVLKRYFIPNPVADPNNAPDPHDAKVILHASSMLNDHMTTIFHNVYRKEKALPARFERRATNARVEKTLVVKFQQFVDQEAQGFLENVDDWLSTHQASINIPDSKCIRLGMGAYLIQGDEKIEN